MAGELLFGEETYKIIGACIQVHKNLGSGFSEEVYAQALAKEFTTLNIQFEQHKKLPIYYNEEVLDQYFVADYVCFDHILLQIKCVNRLKENLTKQVVNYLKTTHKEIGLIINFGEESLKWKRVINTISV